MTTTPAPDPRPKPEPTPPGQRPETTGGFVDKTARKEHKCYECGGAILNGTSYVQDDYYAPYGNGRRYCRSCAKSRQREEEVWMKGHERWLKTIYP